MMRILYVEDNAANLSLVHRVARLGGHEIVNRTSGEAALRDFANIRPDLVLMDIQLEGRMTGLDVVRELRAQGYKVPMIAVTAYAMKGDQEKALDAGCDDYLPKPLPIKKLVALIDMYQKEQQLRITQEFPSTAINQALSIEKQGSTNTEITDQSEAHASSSVVSSVSSDDVPMTVPEKSADLTESQEAQSVGSENVKTNLTSDKLSIESKEKPDSN